MHNVHGRDTATTRRLLAGALVAFAVALTSGRSAWAHQDPPGCSGTAVDFSFMAFRADNTPIDLSESVTECETITYQVTVGKSGLGNPCAFQGGTITITTPDGVIHNVTPGGGVPCIGGTGACSATSAASNTVTYQVSPGDVVLGEVTAGASYTAAFSHTGASHTIGFPKASTTLPLLVQFCDPSTECIDSFCDPNLYDSASGALGNCTTSNVPDSTPCSDIDGNQCTFAGCNGAGSCDQNHLVTTCPADGNPCTADLGCDSVSGACIYTNVPDSTPCPDGDGNQCTHAGCEAGTCVQGHVNTVCPPDGNECTNDLGCNSVTGACVYTNVPDSTPCTDNDSQSCTTAGCEAGSCVQDHISTCLVAVDHFWCYEIHREPFTAGPVNLVDSIGTFNNVTVQRPERLCNPADKNDEDPAAPTHEDHLVGYKVRYSSPSLLGRTVTDQFGAHLVDVKGIDHLMVPSSKSMSGTPPALTPPTVDHFNCYKLRHPKGTPAYPVIPNVKVDDQFGTVTISLKKPYRLCVPADKNLEDPGAESHPQSLLCWRTVKKIPLEPITPTIRNQFGTRIVELLRRTEFCVPATHN